jgi:hypothetical protein
MVQLVPLHRGGGGESGGGRRRGGALHVESS